MQHANSTIKNPHYPVIIIGGGQAALSLSVFLSKKSIDHLVIEKNSLLNAWKEKRWDSFTLVTPNWQCQLHSHCVVAYSHCAVDSADLLRLAGLLQGLIRSVAKG